MSGHLCPSGACREGASLLGVIGEDGRLQRLRTPIPVTGAFVERAERGRDPRRRFRFAEPCAEGGCQNWDGGRCGVVDRVVAAVAELPGSLPPCPIRASCRWFGQAGRDACARCSLVVTLTDPTPADV